MIPLLGDPVWSAVVLSSRKAKPLMTRPTRRSALGLALSVLTFSALPAFSGCSGANDNPAPGSISIPRDLKTGDSAGKAEKGKVIEKPKAEPPK